MKLLSPSRDNTPRKETVERLRRMIVSSGMQPGDAFPTYSELAEQLHISRVTVKRAMDILAATGLVRRLRGKGVYVARRPARRLSDLTQVSVIVTSRLNLFRYPYLREIMTGVIARCEDDNIGLSILSLRDFAVTTRPEEVTAVADSVLLLGDINESYVEKLVGIDIPVVVVDHQVLGVPVDCMVCDNPGATRRAMEHLVALGHRRIAYAGALSMPDAIQQRRQLAASADMPERRDAYLHAMADHGLSAFVQIFETVTSLIAALRTRPPEGQGLAANAPTAVLVNDAMEAHHYCERLAEAGIRVPDDVSVAAAAGAVGDSFWAGKAITRSCVRFEEMGRAAVEQLKRRCGALPLAAPNIIRIGFDFESGATAGPVPSSGR